MSFFENNKHSFKKELWAFAGTTIIAAVIGYHATKNLSTNQLWRYFFCSFTANVLFSTVGHATAKVFGPSPNIVTQSLRNAPQAIAAGLMVGTIINLMKRTCGLNPPEVVQRPRTLSQ